jgi:hypothetical protein
MFGHTHGETPNDTCDMRPVSLGIHATIVPETERVEATRHTALKLGMRGTNARINYVDSHAGAVVIEDVCIIQREAGLINAIESPIGWVSLNCVERHVKVL